MESGLEVYLKETIDETVKIENWYGREILPLFLSELYEFYQTKICGQLCILAKALDSGTRIDDIEKHIKTIQEVTNRHVVIVYRSISWYRRKSFLKHRIPFLIEDGQMFLPFIGLDLGRANDKSIEEIRAFSSSAQLAFLYFLYNKETQINATKLAEIFDVTIMTASRVLNELYDVGLLTYKIAGKTGRSKVYMRKDDPEYYRIGSCHLRNPISKIVYVERIPNTDPVAGLEALSTMTMINPPNKSTRAISRKRYHEIKEQVIEDRAKIVDTRAIEMQIWNYDPAIVSRNGLVDIVSLALSLHELNDERIEQAIEERLREEKWYMG